MADSKIDAATQTMIDNLPEKTGKTLAQWLTVLKRAKLEKHGEMMKLLKGEHSVTHGFANLIVAKYKEQAAGGAATDADLVAAQYAGAKAALRPIYDKIIRIVTRFGEDVELAPKKQYVSLRRNKQFALIQPSTKDRVDVGIYLKGKKPTKRLEASGSFTAMVSHRVRLQSVDEVNDQLRDWLRQAYLEA